MSFVQTDIFPIQHPSMSNPCARERTFKKFKNWISPHSVHKIVENGFFLNSVCVPTCYYCGLSIYSMMTAENAWDLHFSLAPSCPFVVLHKNNGGIPISSQAMQTVKVKIKN